MVVSASIDCPNLINLALGMRMNIQSSSTMSSLYSNCCLSPGITCDGASRVTQIDWSYYGLDGVINSTAIPSKVTIFDMHGDSLVGSFPSSLPVGLTLFDVNYCNFGGSFPNNFPASLTFLSLFNNYFTGSIASLPPALTFVSLGFNSFSGNIPTNLPIGLTYLGLQYNSFTGTIPTNLPSTLTKINIGANELSGTIPSLPLGLTFLGLYGNYITGPIPTTWPTNITYINVGPNLLTGTMTNVIWPFGLTDLEVDGNLLTGDLPLFPNSIQILRLGYPDESANHFTGTLLINQPTDLSITNNWITDIRIADASLLTSCDLSNNPLLGNPNIAALTICTANGLYNASSLPVTKTTAKLATTSTRITTSLSILLKSSNLAITSTMKTATSAIIRTTIKTTLQTTIKTSPSSIASSSSSIKTSFKLSSTLHLSTSSTHDSTASTSNLAINSQIITTQLVFALNSKISRESEYLNAKSLNSSETEESTSFLLVKLDYISFDVTWYSILKIASRILVNFALLVVIFAYAPFAREFNKKMFRYMGKQVEETTIGKSSSKKSTF